MAKHEKVDVVFYEKTHSHCPSCLSMKGALNRWIKSHDHLNVKVITLSAEDNANALKEQYGPVLSAPVVEVTRDGETNVVSGNNPDILVDYLNGEPDVWDEP